MSTMSEALSLLHILLRELAEAEATLAEGPRAIALAEKQVAAVEQHIEQQKQAIKSARKHADELNLKLRTFEANLRKLEGQLNTASSNKEYDIIKGQIETGRKERGEIEEAALVAMEEIDGSQVRLKQLEADLVLRKQAVQSTKSEVDGKRHDLESNITTLNARIAESEKVIPGEHKAAYLRLRKAHGADALSPLEDDFCSACDGRVINQDLVRIRMSEFMPCRSCGRILYGAR
ncbi:MAG: zinc ribbon domain-containing protein [Planctomycetota bacterium]